MSTSVDFPALGPHPRRQQSPTIMDELAEEIGTVDPNEIVTDAPTAQFRLGYLDVTCLVLNHIIGRLPG